MHQQNIDEDAIDRFLEKLDSLFKRHGWKIIISTPPVIGFLIFFTYFTRNKFYPSFDILQFSSLLLSAFLLVALIIGALVVIMTAPSFLFKFVFFESKVAKENFRKKIYIMSDIENSNAFGMLVRIIAQPIILGALAFYLSILLATKYYIATFIAIPIIISIVSPLESILQNRLSKKIYLPLCFTLLIAITLGNLSILMFIATTYENIKILGDDTVQSIVFLIITAIITLTISFSCFVALAGIRYSLYMNALVAIFILFYSGFASSLPETVMEKLDIGNYKAVSVALKKDFCEPKIFKLDINEDCTISDPYVTWSMGDIYFIKKESKQGGTYTLKIPKENVRAIVTHTPLDKSNAIK